MKWSNPLLNLEIVAIATSWLLAADTRAWTWNLWHVKRMLSHWATSSHRGETDRFSHPLPALPIPACNWFDRSFLPHISFQCAHLSHVSLQQPPAPFQVNSGGPKRPNILGGGSGRAIRWRWKVSQEGVLHLLDWISMAINGPVPQCPINCATEAERWQVALIWTRCPAMNRKRKRWFFMGCLLTPASKFSTRLKLWQQLIINQRTLPLLTLSSPHVQLKTELPSFDHP